MVRSRESLEEEIRQATPRSQTQWERGKRSMPGGIIKGAYWSPPHPIYVDHAEGCYLWDIDGRRYLDLANHHTAMILGHSHPAVVEAIRREARRGMGLGAPTTLEAEMAEEIVRRVPSIEKVRFTNSGTEASLHATRLVRAITGKPKVAKFEGAYHGSHDALELSISPSMDWAGPADAPNAVAAHDGMSRTSEEDAVILPYGQPESVELLLREQRDELAGVFYDPKAGIYDLPPEFPRFVREITEELGLPLVWDEVVSFRAGLGGYQATCSVRPDLTTFGKIVGGGLPVGALGGRADLMDLLDNTQGPSRLGQSGTFSGNAMTLGAGLATLRTLTPEVYGHLERLRARLHQGLETVFAVAGVACQVVSEGPLVNVHLTDRPVRTFRDAASSDKELSDQIGLSLLLKGFYGWGGLGIALSAPMTSDHIDALLSALKDTLAEPEA